MVNIIYGINKIGMDSNGITNIEHLLKNNKTKNETKKDKQKKKLAPLDIAKVTRMKEEALEKQDFEHIIAFGKFRGIHYNELLTEDMEKYRKFLKRCPFKNDQINHFLKWLEDENNKKK